MSEACSNTGNPSTTGDSAAKSSIHKLTPPPDWQPGRRQRSGHVVAVGEVAETWQPRVEQLRAVVERRRAAFAGDCYTCRDSGPCDRCERGRAVEAGRRQAEIVANALLPPRYNSQSLDSYAALAGHDAAALAAIRRYAGGWCGGGSLALIGPHGTGKTGLLVGALRLVANWFAARRSSAAAPIRFVSVPSLLSDFRALPRDVADPYPELTRHLPLLALDDLGAERATDWVAERLYTIVNERYNRNLPIWLTSNLDFEALAERIGERTVWRLYEMCEVVNVAGANLRAREGGR